MSNRIRDYLPAPGNWLAVLLGALSLLGLYAISRYNFLLFHCLAEAFSIVIAIAVFAIFWNTRRFLENEIYLVIGLGCLCAGMLDLIYIFAYPGMSVFPGADGNLALQGKTAAQWFVSLSCVGAFLFLRRRVDQNLTLSVYSALLALALGCIFYWRVFPDCYVEGVGQTLFERMGLVVSCTAYLGAVALLVGNRRAFDGRVFRLLAATLIVFFVEDFASAVSADINGFARTVAHLCQVVALYFVYKAFVEVGLTRPYGLLFRNQQQSAEALARQRQFLETVLENVQSGIVACDADGVVTLLNHALRESHGLAEEPVPAKQWAEHYDLYHPDGRTRMTAEEIPLVRALRGERLHDLEMMVVPPAGPARTFVASGEPLIGEDGLTRGAVVSVHDITERKRAEEAMRASEERYRSLFNSMTEGFALHEIVTGENGQPCDYRYLDVNPAFERLTGFHRRDVIGQLKRQVTPGEDEFWIKIYGAVAQTGQPVRFEHRSTLSNRYWQVYAYHPAPGQFAALFSDISERKRAEELLRRSEEGLRLVLEASGVGWWSLDLVSGALTADQRCNALFGLPPGTAPSFALFLERISADDRPLAQRHVAEAKLHPGDYEAEYRTLWSDGSLHWLLTKGRSFHDTPGKPFLKGIVMDITDRKQIHEEQLQRHRAELAHMARLNMMGEMAASLAHELNQPLHAMKNYAYGSICRLRKTPERDPELVAALEQISEEANRAAAIVRRVRVFVQKREPQVAALSLNRLVEEIVLLSRAELEQHQGRVDLELSENLPMVQGDPIQIEQVLMNLVHNGLDAMDETPADKRLLGIKTARQGENAIQVDVCDCGKGIAAADLEQIFEPFFTTKPEGMGMGLAISRSIIQSHGGRLWATVNEVQGCTFHFTLPVEKKD